MVFLASFTNIFSSSSRDEEANGSQNSKAIWIQLPGPPTIPLPLLHYMVFLKQSASQRSYRGRAWQRKRRPYETWFLHHGTAKSLDFNLLQAAQRLIKDLRKVNLHSIKASRANAHPRPASPASPSRVKQQRVLKMSSLVPCPKTENGFFFVNAFDEY